jgi:nucleosome binding factor SPN SPT16 subunit
MTFRHCHYKRDSLLAKIIDIGIEIETILMPAGSIPISIAISIYKKAFKKVSKA